MDKLIVIAEAEELKLVNDLIGKEIIQKLPVIITGVGALNVISTLRDIPKDTEIINVGYAGSKNLSINKYYCVTLCTLNHDNVDYQEPMYELSIDRDWKGSLAPCYSGSDFVLKTKTSDCLFDMELAYIMSLGFTNVKAYKYVSDNLDLQEYRKQLESSDDK